MRNFTENNKIISEIINRLKDCRSILFITGAGISVESGLPTYRGIGGLYNDSITEEGIPIEVALAGETLNTKPEITWKYLSQIERNTRGATFNRGHGVISEMEKSFERVWVLTQNIDGFHHMAGSEKVIEIHGNIHDIVCNKCSWRIRIKNFSEISIPPICPKCRNIARPDVVFFGEMLPYDKLDILYSELDRGFDIYFSVGTTSVFPYISQPILDAKRRGMPTVEINPEETLISEIVDYKIEDTSAVALDRVWEEYRK